MHKSKTNHGFTIVELLIVIVIIGILAAITLVSYIGISKKATEASLTSELSGAKKQLELFNTEYGKYPNTIRCDIADSNVNKCIKSNAILPSDYRPNSNINPTFYRLTAKTGSIAFEVSKNSPPISKTQPSSCPSGFIPVPGSSTYGTNGFCVMKYEAKQVGATNVPISQAAGLPWVNINQSTAATNSANVAGCTGCHLITEAEWMTIAQNVLGVANNWSSGAVGSGYIYSGHNDNSPANALAANIDDNLGYTGTLNSSGEVAVTNGMKGDTQKRTLTLDNGEVIWDMAGNVYDWTAGQSTTGQPGIVGNFYTPWIQWPAVTTKGALPIDPSPGGTGIIGSETWNGTNGVGVILSNTAETALHGFFKGGSWISVDGAGITYLILDNPPNATGASLGFRVAAPAQ